MSLTLAQAALADDSTAALGAGGLVLTRSEHIRMASEDLYLSPRQVKVHYTFLNDGAKDVDTVVAFPLPDIDLNEFEESPLGTTFHSEPNFVGFKVSVDGKPVKAIADERAILAGKDVTAIVRSAGLPLNVVDPTFYDKLQNLSPKERARLYRLGLVDVDGDPGNPSQPPHVQAQWIVKTRFWWRQRFPAGRIVTVDHTYQPVTGGFLFSVQENLGQDELARLRHDYCIDGPTLDAIDRLLASDPQRVFFADQTDFVLVTANNWEGPIGRFHLTLDKLKAGNILSLCWPGRLHKTGPTRFESTLTRFAPNQDLRLLVVENPKG